MQIEFRCEGIPFYGDIDELRTENDSTTPQGGREFDYVWYGQGDPITGERVFDWKSYLHKDSEHELICIPKGTMEEVL